MDKPHSLVKGVKILFQVSKTRKTIKEPYLFIPHPISELLTQTNKNNPLKGQLKNRRIDVVCSIICLFRLGSVEIAAHGYDRFIDYITGLYDHETEALQLALHRKNKQTDKKNPKKQDGAKTRRKRE